MDVKPINRKSVPDDIVLQIRSMIESGELAPDDRLPAERKLAEMFSVSRNTVREAIRTLAQSGVLETIQGSGTFVREVSDQEPSFANAVLPGDPDEREIFEVRKLLEPEIAALAAQNAMPDDIVKMESALDMYETAIQAGKTGAVFEQQFHEQLAKASGNDVLRQMVAVLHHDLADSLEDGAQSARRQQAYLAGHKAIVEAVKAGHIMQAERAMREHLDDVERIVFSKTISSGR